MTKKKQDQIAKELFQMVYGWGRWNLKVDHKAPSFVEKINELVEEVKKDQKKGKKGVGSPSLPTYAN